MKLIPLTMGKSAQVDDEDFNLINMSWSYKPNGYNGYAVSSFGIRMHNEIMKPENGFIVDHKDGNGLNNQRYNLRICTQQQNAQNRRKFKGSNKYKGVYYYPNNICNPYRIHISKIIGGIKYRFRKSFKTEEEAVLAYNEKAKEFYGEFANLNIIKEK